jgi:hypothetical protein
MVDPSVPLGTAIAEIYSERVKGPTMSDLIVIEDIEGMRRRVGIDDVELREEIGRLKIGDLVQLTLMAPRGSFAGETLPVRITRIRDSVFRGKLSVKPTLSGLSNLPVGAPVRFSTTHIHSVVKK